MRRGIIQRQLRHRCPPLPVHMYLFFDQLYHKKRPFPNRTHFSQRNLCSRKGRYE